MFPLVALQAGANAIAGLFGLLILVAQIALIWWTYTDAQKRSDQPAFLWAIVVFLAPILGIVLYFLLGRN
ncbi:PLDc N-terminal domain-containing protein [Halalkalirubrum salinum]|uniref:PLDc N-terminal domain-containing protein n=1 Tax=Halalkalirubrum salinum TaxID=2563889 RepID=UPI0010FAECB7|nr:PLDc N-terminal domain-containing protein [Halalkalirubrum salinum]